MSSYAKLLVVYIVFLSVSTPCAGSSQHIFCFQYFLNGTDTGFSFNAITGASEALTWIRAKYASSNVSVRSRNYINQGTVTNMTAQMVAMIERDGCTGILSTSPLLYATLSQGRIDEMCGRYPDVHFWVLSSPAVIRNHRPANAHASVFDAFSAMFPLGAAAAVECSSCVALLLPLETQQAAGTAMGRGMRFGQQFRTDGANVSELCPLLVFHHGGVNKLPSERAFITSMHRRGCSIVAVSGSAGLIERQHLRTELGRPMFSITLATDGGLFVGDSVLTSLPFEMKAPFIRFMESRILRVPFVSGLDSGVKIGAVSPIANPNVSVAIAAAERALGSSNSILWCQPMYDQLGVLVNPIVNGTPSCISFARYSAMTFVERGLEQFPQFQAPTQCSPGTFARYNLQSDLLLTCVQCPNGSYSSEYGATSCGSCPLGQVVSEDSASCRVPVFSAGDRGVVLVALLAVLLPAAAIAAATGAYAFFWLSRRAQHVPPPGGPEVAMAVIGVDSSRSSSGWREEILLGAYCFEVLRQNVVGAAARQKAFLVSALPASFILAADQPEQLLAAAEEVERAMSVHSTAKDSTTKLFTYATVTYGYGADMRSKRNRTVGDSSSKLSEKVTFKGPVVEELIRMARDPLSQTNITMPEQLFQRLKNNDPTMTDRLTRCYTVKGALLDKKPEEEEEEKAPKADAHSVGIEGSSEPTRHYSELRVVNMRFRCGGGGAPGPRCRIPAPLVVHASPAPAERKLQQQDAARKGSAVLRKRQQQTLCDVFECIASRFLFTATPETQHALALSLSKRLHIFLPSAAGRAAGGSDGEQSPTSPTDRLRNSLLQQVVPCLTPLIVESLDELHLRDHIREIGSI